MQWVKDNNFNNHIIKQAEDIANGVTSYMNSDSYYNEYWEQFKSYTHDLDKIRNENLIDVEPKFKKYI